jgi:hypothetical protein
MPWLRWMAAPHFSGEWFDITWGTPGAICDPWIDEPWIAASA